MEHPQRVFNDNESGFAQWPKTGKVLAPQGWKNLYQIKSGNDKENVTFLIVFNVTGSICPPLFFPYIRLPKALFNNMLDNWVLAKSESGCAAMYSSNIFVNDFDKWLNVNEIKRPIILFINTHTSHIKSPLSKFGKKIGYYTLSLLI